jgi:hypothetical protein
MVDALRATIDISVASLRWLVIDGCNPSFCIWIFIFELQNIGLSIGTLIGGYRSDGLVAVIKPMASRHQGAPASVGQLLWPAP